MSRNVQAFVRSTMAAKESAKLAAALKNIVAVEEPGEDADPFAGANVNADDEKAASDGDAMLAPLTHTKIYQMDWRLKSVFNALNELRTKKIQHELVVKEMQQKLQGMQRHLDSLKIAQSKCDARIEATTEKLKGLKENLRFSNENAELVIKMLQGQDEIAQQPIISDYKDAVLIPRGVVETLNVSVRELGSNKIETMTKMKDFRKSINFMQWERNYLDMQTKDLEEHYTDLHMLRMTRQLNDFLKGSDPSDRHKKETIKLESKMKHMKSAHLQKMDKIEFEVRKIEKKASGMRAENKRLAAQHDELKSSVAVRESICRSKENQTAGASAASAAQLRMKAVVTRRKLMDLARAQTDEIEYLRSELDRLRQRTFPSFATAKAEAVVQYPDE